MPPSAQAEFELETFGFTVLESVINADAATRCSEICAGLDAEHGTDYTHQEAYARHVMGVHGLDRTLLDLADHPAVLEVLEHFMGPQIILGSMNARNVRPGDPGQPLHSDVPGPLRKAGSAGTHPVMFNAVWMFDGFTGTNGATRIVPGSHLAESPEPPAGVSVPWVVQPTGPPGSVLVFNGQCWHGGGPNRADHVRHAVFAHYRVSPWMRFQCDPHVGFPVEWWDGLRPRQRELLRMEQGVGQPNSADY